MIRTNLKLAVRLGTALAAVIPAVPALALTSNLTWQNLAFTPQTSTFVAQFDAVPNAANMDGVTALAPKTVASYTDCAILVRFNSSGMIDVRNGAAYAASTMVYTPGTSYHFRIVANVASKTYSAYVTPQGGTEQTLGTGCAFRTDQAAATNLCSWGAIADIGTHSVTNTTVSPTVVVSAGPDQSIALPATASLVGSVTVYGMTSVPSGTTMTWTKVSGPGTVTFGNAYGQSTTASFSAAGTYVLQLIATYGTESASDTVTVQVLQAGTGKISSTTWQNGIYAVQSGTFTAEYDATPNTANMDGVVGLSAAAGHSYSNYATMVRFNSTGTIDARNGGAYAAAGSIAYAVGTNYHFRLVVNVPSHTYSVYVTPNGGAEQTLGTNYAFRAEQAGVTSLAYWVMVSEVGTFTVSNFKVTAQAITPTPLSASACANKTITAGQSCSLSGSASGGTSPYTYSWSPTTGLSSATVANPTASPAATTTYTLTVRDAAGATAGASMTVTVTPATPTTGTTYYVNPAGNDANAGTAAAPWKTLAKATSTAKAGSTVIVQAGTYNEVLRPSISGTSSALITFKSETARGAKITSGVDLSSADYVRADGFDITNPTAEAYAVTVQAYSSTAHGHGVQIANNYIHDGGGHAVWACNVTDLLIENNEMYNNYHDGIIVTGASRNNQNVTIRGNYIHHNGQDGIHPEGNNFLIENNRIDDQYSTAQHQDGLEIYGPINGMVIRNNIISDTTQNIYVSAENYAGSYIRNVEILGNLVFARNNPNLGKGIFVVGNTADVTNIRVEGNTFAYVAMNPFTDAYASSSSCYISGLTVRNNIFYMCDMSLGLTNPATIDYNIHYYPSYFDIVNNGGTYYTSLTALSSATGFETHGLQVDPLFVNAAARDFHLTSSSPAINKGITVVDLTVDPDGNPRPLGGTYDIGAYEKQ